MWREQVDRLDARLAEIPSRVCHELAGRVSEIDEFKGWWRGRADAYPSVLRTLKARAIRTAAEATPRIAGGASFPPAGNPPWGPGRSGRASGRAARGAAYAEALRAVFAGHRGMEFGEELILARHAQLFRTFPEERGRGGRYRTVSDRPPAFLRGGMESLALRPAEPHLVPAGMRRLTEWTSARLASREFHPLLVIAAFLLEFLAIRPFSKGNGDVSRLLAAQLLLAQGYGHVAFVSMDGIIAERRAEYLLALRRAQARRNFPRPEIAPWLRAFLEILQAQVLALRPLLERRPREDLLSGNQQAVLGLFDRHPEVTIRLVVRELGLPRDTARQVVGRLRERNLVMRAGEGRAARYLRPPPSPR